MRTALFVLLALQTPQGSTYRDDAEGVRLVLPPGWQQVPAATLRSYEESIQRNGGAVGHYAAAFGRRSAAQWFEYPYVMIEAYDSGAVSPTTIMSQLNLLKPQPSSSHLLAGAPVYGVAAYVPAKDAVLWDMGTALANGHRVANYVAIRATSRGYISIFAYGLAPDSLRVAALRDSFLAGLSIDETHAYRPAAANQATDGGGGTLFETALGIAAVFGLFAIVLLTLRSLAPRDDSITP
jgi:hypothetical protein